MAELLGPGRSPFLLNPNTHLGTPALDTPVLYLRKASWGQFVIVVLANSNAHRNI